MGYSVNLEGFEGQSIVVEPPGLITNVQLLVNGQPAPKGKKRGEMLLRRNDGKDVVASWKYNFLDVPNLIVDGKTITVVPPLKWYEWAWNGLPILLVTFGGALGGLIGAIVFGFNLKIFRSSGNPLAKYALTGAISAGAFIVYFILAVLISAAIN